MRVTLFDLVKNLKYYSSLTINLYSINKAIRQLLKMIPDLSTKEKELLTLDHLGTEFNKYSSELYKHAICIVYLANKYKVDWAVNFVKDLKLEANKIKDIEDFLDLVLAQKDQKSIKQKLSQIFKFVNLDGNVSDIIKIYDLICFIGLLVNLTNTEFELLPYDACNIIS